MIVVLDASIIIKWLLADPEKEEHTDKAQKIMLNVIENKLQVVQPVHWLAEVGAVLSRLSPQTIIDDMHELFSLELPIANSNMIYHRACDLAISLNHHLFDTLYHAVALEIPNAYLITADQKYLHKAKPLGNIISLADFDL